MHSADYAVAKCPSVRLSHAGIMSERLHISSKVFSSSDSPTILVFRTKRDGNIPMGTPWTGASNASGMKNHDFRPLSRFISELMQDRAIVTTEGK